MDNNISNLLPGYSTLSILSIERNNREAIARGVSYLNRRFPDVFWPSRINLETLNIYDCSKCVIGQLCGGENKRFSFYNAVCISMENDDIKFDYPASWAANYGFGLSTGTFELLTYLWKEKIKELIQEENEKNAELGKTEANNRESAAAV